MSEITFGFIGLVCDWDPMQIDYISSWNKYHELDKKTTRFEHRSKCYVIICM